VLVGLEGAAPLRQILAQKTVRAARQGTTWTSASGSRRNARNLPQTSALGVTNEKNASTCSDRTPGRPVVRGRAAGAEKPGG